MLGGTGSLGGLLQAVGKHTHCLHLPVIPADRLSMLLCASEASRSPSSSHEDHCLDSHSCSPCRLHSFCPCCCQVHGVAWPGILGRHSPTSTVSLSFSVSLMHWLVSSHRGLCSCSDLSFNQNESWCRVLYVPRENSRGHLCAVVLEARAGGPSQEKRELWMLLRETSTAIKPEAAPGFTTRTGTQGDRRGCHLSFRPTKSS